MENTVEGLFTKEVMDGILKRLQLGSRVEKLGDFENYVFEVYRKDQPLILRVTHSTHRSEDEILAELDWMNYLYQNNVNCPKVFMSSNGQLIETAVAADGSLFFACLFSKVKGNPVKVNSKEYNEQLFYAWGKATGKMHAVTKSYRPKEGMKLRPLWHEEELLQLEQFVPDEKEVIENTRELLKELKELPQNNDNFGLIHTDIHSGNFFYDGESVHVFDFDDSSYHWFASDIAIPLYYSIFYGKIDATEEERENFANNFLDHFLKGYAVHNNFPENLRVHIPLFFKLRDITLFSVLHKKINPEDRDVRLNRLLAEMKKRIIRKEAIVQIH